MFGLPSLPTIGIAVAAGVAVIVGAFATGSNYQYRKDQVASLKAEIAILHFDAGEAARKAKEADADNANIEAADAANQEKIDAAETVIARGYGCPTPAELEWLRNIGEAGLAKNPPGPPELREAGSSAASQGCDPWPIIAAHERAGRLKANDVIVKTRRWYEGLRSDYGRK